MSVWAKLFTAVRGGVNEAAEAAADSQALRILDQEIRDAENALRKARSSLAGIMATGKRLEKRVVDLREKADRDMASAQAAVQAGRKDLASALATRISATRSELQTEQTSLERTRSQEKSMSKTVQQTAARIVAMKREIESVKATESLQKAQSAIAASQSGAHSRLGNAMDSLQRVKDRQEQTAARLEAGDELAALESGSDLDKQLLEAGIGDGQLSVDDVMAEIMGSSTPAIPLEASPALEPPKRS